MKNEIVVTLIHPGKTAEEDEKTAVFAQIEPTGRDEFEAAGQNGMKAEYKLTVWDSEYDEQPEVIVNGDRYTIYRTYGPRKDAKTELYIADRVGNHGR